MKKFIITIIILVVVLVVVLGTLSKAIDRVVILEAQVDSLIPYKVRHDRIMHISEILSAYPLYGIEPYVYAAAFDTVGRRDGVQWEAIAATIDIETGRTWVPTQTSSSDCKGIMQLREHKTDTTKNTVRYMCQLLNYPYQYDTTVWFEIRCIDMGTKYMAMGFEKHGYDEGFKYYVGGPRFKDTEQSALKRGTRSKESYKRIVEMAAYIKYYQEIVSREYKKLCMMSGRTK